MGHEIVFPDAPRSELERTVAALVVHGQAVLRTQGRLRNLLTANRRIVQNLDLEDTFRAVVGAGAELVGARRATLEILDADGALERVVAVGLDSDGHHLSDLEAHLTPHTRISVPVQVRDNHYGTLNLTEPVSGGFTDEDEELATALAATAGVAIDNGRLFADAELREQWTTAVADVTSALLGDDELDDILTMIVDRVARFVDADVVFVVVPVQSGESVRVAVASGSLAPSIQGRVYPTAGSLAGHAMEAGNAVSSDAFEPRARLEWQPQLGPTIAIPLRAFGANLGALVAGRTTGGKRFSEAELRMADDFGQQTSVAIAVARGRRDRRRLERTDDRNRIARDLHDHVIQRLFASGLALQSAVRTAEGPLRARLEEQVDTIDAAIGEIRTAVFALGSAADTLGRTARDRVLDTVSELGPALTVPPMVTFSGPVDVIVLGELANDVVAVVRESLTNVARHAPAASSAVRVHVDAETVGVVVTDDGPGPGDSVRRSGTANITARAVLRDGTCTILPAVGGGTEVRWSIPRESTTDRESAR
jgi:signal transduction histidine kinase